MAPSNYFCCSHDAYLRTAMTRGPVEKGNCQRIPKHSIVTPDGVSSEIHEQDNSGLCWSFANSTLLKNSIYRITGVFLSPANFPWKRLEKIQGCQTLFLVKIFVNISSLDEYFFKKFFLLESQWIANFFEREARPLVW